VYRIILQDEKGQKLQLTGTPQYTVTSVSGLDPASATVNISENALFDGATFNSSKVNSRNIVINFAINTPAEDGRIALYKTVKPKRPLRVYVSGTRRKAYIDGYVESLSVDIFGQKEVAQISILCPNPFFSDINSPFTAVGDIELTAINTGDVETGMLITLTAEYGSISSPTVTNTLTGEYITVTQSMSLGDVVTIDTTAGQRSVTLTHNGTTTNIINKLDPTSTWLQLEIGENMFEQTAAMHGENVVTTITYKVLYQGV